MNHHFHLPRARVSKLDNWHVEIDEDHVALFTRWADAIRFAQAQAQAAQAQVIREARAHIRALDARTHELEAQP